MRISPWHFHWTTLFDIMVEVWELFQALIVVLWWNMHNLTTIIQSMKCIAGLGRILFCLFDASRTAIHTNRRIVFFSFLFFFRFRETVYWHPSPRPTWWNLWIQGQCSWDRSSGSLLLFGWYLLHLPLNIFYDLLISFKHISIFGLYISSCDYVKVLFTGTFLAVAFTIAANVVATGTGFS